MIRRLKAPLSSLSGVAAWNIEVPSGPPCGRRAVAPNAYGIHVAACLLVLSFAAVALSGCLGPGPVPDPDGTVEAQPGGTDHLHVSLPMESTVFSVHVEAADTLDCALGVHIRRAVQSPDLLFWVFQPYEPNFGENIAHSDLVAFTPQYGYVGIQGQRPDGSGGIEDEEWVREFPVETSMQRDLPALVVAVGTQAQDTPTFLDVGSQCNGPHALSLRMNGTLHLAFTEYHFPNATQVGGPLPYRGVEAISGNAGFTAAETTYFRLINFPTWLYEAGRIAIESEGYSEEVLLTYGPRMLYLPFPPGEYEVEFTLARGTGQTYGIFVEVP